MPYLTDADRVEEIVEVDPSINLDIFILQASTLYLAVVGGDTHPDEQEELIVRNLSAHFYCCERDMRATSTSIGGAISESYQSSIDKYLELTHYGQKAMLLDTSKLLSQYNAQIKKPAGDGITPIMGGFHCGREADLNGDGEEL